MKKRKLFVLITLGFVALYLLSSVTFAFMSWGTIEEEQRRVGQDCSLQLQEQIHLFFENPPAGETYGQEDFDRLLGQMTFLFDTKYPMIFALVNNQTKEVVVRSKSIVYFVDAESIDFRYVDIEPYLTEEIRNEFSEVMNELDTDWLWLRRMSFSIENGKYIPVQMTIGVSRTEDYRTIEFTDKGVDVTVNAEDTGIRLLPFNLQKDSYAAKLYEKMEIQLENKINELKGDEDYSTSMSYGAFNSYNSSVMVGRTANTHKYTYILVGPAYNEFVEAFTDEYFVASMIIQGIFFAIAYLVALVVAGKFYRKSEQMTKSQRAFTSAAAHELKTPLSVIQNQCECIMENVAPEKNEEYIKSVYDEAVRMNGIVTNFLWYNRLVNTQKLQKEICSLSEIVRMELQKYRAFAKMKNVEIIEEITDTEIFKNCNRDLISMAVDNYLSNAIKYATGEKKVRVKLKGNTFSVYNTSDGIRGETADSMWDLLSRESKARTKDDSSTGMGLPICAEIFKAHGYEYGYRNLSGAVEFYFTF